MKYFSFIALSFVVLTSCTQTQNTPSDASSTGNVQTSSSISNDENVLSIGSGSHVVQIFSDFQCPACISLHKTVYPLFEKFAEEGRLTIEYRQFPLTSIHPNAYGDSVALYCVAEVSDNWKEYADNLYALEEEKSWATVSNADRIALAKSLGIEGSTLEDCINSQSTKQYVDRDMALGDSLGVNATPTFLLDGTKLTSKVFQNTETFNTFFNRILGE